MDSKYEIYKFRATKTYIEPNYDLILTGLTYKQAIKYLNSQDEPTDYFMLPYREEYHGELRE